MRIIPEFQNGSYTFKIESENDSDRAVIAAFLNGDRPDIRIVVSYQTTAAGHLPNDAFAIRRKDADISMEDLETASETREEMLERHQMEREVHDMPPGMTFNEIDSFLREGKPDRGSQDWEMRGIYDWQFGRQNASHEILNQEEIGSLLDSMAKDAITPEEIAELNRKKGRSPFYRPLDQTEIDALMEPGEHVSIGQEDFTSEKTISEWFGEIAESTPPDGILPLALSVLCACARMTDGLISGYVLLRILQLGDSVPEGSDYWMRTARINDVEEHAAIRNIAGIHPPLPERSLWLEKLYEKFMREIAPKTPPHLSDRPLPDVRITEMSDGKIECRPTSTRAFIRCMLNAEIKLFAEPGGECFDMTGVDSKKTVLEAAIARAIRRTALASGKRNNGN